MSEDRRYVGGQIDEKLHTSCVIVVIVAQYQRIQIVQTQTELLGVAQEQG